MNFHKRNTAMQSQLRETDQCPESPSYGHRYLDFYLHWVLMNVYEHFNKWIICLASFKQPYARKVHPLYCCGSDAYPLIPHSVSLNTINILIHSTLAIFGLFPICANMNSAVRTILVQAFWAINYAFCWV